MVLKTPTRWVVISSSINESLRWFPWFIPWTDMNDAMKWGVRDKTLINNDQLWTSITHTNRNEFLIGQPTMIVSLKTNRIVCLFSPPCPQISTRCPPPPSVTSFSDGFPYPVADVKKTEWAIWSMAAVKALTHSYKPPTRLLPSCLCLDLMRRFIQLNQVGLVSSKLNRKFGRLS